MTFHKIKVIHCAGSLSEQIGGPAHSVPGLCKGLIQQGIDVTLCRVGNNDRVHLVDGLKNCYVSGSKLPFFGNTLANNMEGEILKSEFDIVHTHCVWHMAGLAASKAASRRAKPHIITLRGMLTSWAVAHKYWKKKIAWMLYQKNILKNAACIHCTSVDEMNDYRKLGLINPVAVIPNGIDMPETIPNQARQKLNDKWPELQGKKLLLFFSRVNPKKGLDMLIDAWKIASARSNGWHLIIAGPNENNYQSVIQQLVSSAGLNESVLFTGPLYGKDKACILSGTDIFILPTYSENFGIAVGEALAHGKPVITTTGAPWQDIVKYNCGWWVNPSVEAINDAIEKAIVVPDAERQIMGENGRGLIAEKYSWEQIAVKMGEVYRWVKDGEYKPDCIFMN